MTRGRGHTFWELSDNLKYFQELPHIPRNPCYIAYGKTNKNVRLFVRPTGDARDFMKPPAGLWKYTRLLRPSRVHKNRVGCVGCRVKKDKPVLEFSVSYIHFAVVCVFILLSIFYPTPLHTLHRYIQTTELRRCRVRILPYTTLHKSSGNSKCR